MEIKSVSMTVNGKKYNFSVGENFGQIPPNETLIDTIRQRLGLKGSKKSCNQGVCGCCTVIMDGDAVASCMVLTADCDGKTITTIEGLKDPVTGGLSELQNKFIEHYAFQCGFCTPGIIMASKALLDKNPQPDKDEITEALSGNYCRCISHYHVIEAVEALAGKEGE